MSSELDSDKEDVILVDKKEKSDNKEDGSKKSDKNGTILYIVFYKFLQFHNEIAKAICSKNSWRIPTEQNHMALEFCDNSSVVYSSKNSVCWNNFCLHSDRNSWRILQPSAWLTKFWPDKDIPKIEMK